MKKYLLISFLIILGIFVFAPKIYAATYYVDKLGNDGNAGTSAGAGNAWLTMQSAHTQAANGDTVYVNAGTYEEIGASEYGGIYMNPAKGITWIASGEVIVQANASSKYIIYIRNSSQDISFTGFTFDVNEVGTITHGIYTHNDATGTYTFNDCNFIFDSSTYGIYTFSTSASLVIDNATVTGGGAATFQIYSDFNMTTSTLDVNPSSYIFNIKGSGTTMTVDDNTINPTAVIAVFNVDSDITLNVTDNTITPATSLTNLIVIPPTSDGGTLTLTSNTITTSIAPSDHFFEILGNYSANISDNTFTLSSASQIADKHLFFMNDSYDSTFNNNTFTTETEDNYTHIQMVPLIGSTAGTPTITNNTFNSKSLGGYILSVGHDATPAIGVMNKLDGAIITGNKVLGAAYWDDSILNHSTHNIIVGYNINAQIEHNFVAGGGYGIIVKSNNTMQYTSGGVYNNILYNNNIAGIVMKGMGGVDVVNNTIYNAIDTAEHSFGVDVRYHNEEATATASTNCSVYNNIIYGITPTTTTFYSINVGEYSTSGFSNDNNSFYTQSGDINLKYNNTNNNTISAWQTLTSDATNSIEADPLFVSTSTLNFFLQTGSPAIGVGTTTLGSTYELGIEKAATWPGPATTTRVTWDLGAYVYEDGVTVTESSSSTDLTEAGTTDTYTVVLDHLPTASVVITVSVDSQSSVDSSTLTFTTGDWSDAQTVTVTATNDDIDEHTSTITHTAASSDTSYDGITISSVSANVTDNDTAGMTQSETTATVTEDGTTDTYTLVLDSEPTDDVVVTVTPDSQSTVSPTTLTFTSANWDTVQTVTITAVDDTTDEDDSHSGTITHTAASDDTNYDGYSLTDITVTITDNDTSGGGGASAPAPAVGTGTADTSVGMNQSGEVGNVSSTGNNLLMYINSTASFDTEVSNYGTSVSQNHSLNITNLDLFHNIVTITIHSNPITLTLTLDEIKYVDLDNDGINDLEVKFEDVVVNRAEITVKNLNEDNVIPETVIYTLFKYPNSPKVYLLEDNTKRWIKDEATFNSFNYNWNDIQVIDSSITYSDGEDVSVKKEEISTTNNDHIFTSFLNIGITSEEVRQLQTKLKALGYFTYEYITGYFGPITAQAVKDFQKANDIMQVGYVGPQTRGALNR